MMLAFLIWSVCALLFIVLGISARKKDKPVGFWANASAPEVTDVKKYNAAVSWLFIVFAIVFELLGLPLLFSEQNSPAILFSILGMLPLVIVTMVVYTRIESKYRKK